jgi:hypothetical protein
MQPLRERIEPRIRRLVALVCAAASVLAPAAVALMLSPVGAEVALASAPVEAGNARLVGLPFGGLLSNRWPVLFQVSRDGRQIVRAVGAIELRCSQGGSFTEPDRWSNVPLTRRGTFRARYRDTFQDGGDRVEVEDSLRGTVNSARTRITGTWRNRMRVRMADGTADTCDSGRLRFIAER